MAHQFHGPRPGEHAGWTAQQACDLRNGARRACIALGLVLSSITGLALRIIAAVGVWFALCLPATASHPVTGNGFGFAVVAPESGQATRFYPHPYSFVRPDPAHPLSEGIETANFIKTLS